MVQIWVLILSIVLSLGVGALVAGYLMYTKGKQEVEQKFVQLGKDATKIIDDAKAEGEKKKKELISEGKAEVASLKKEHEQEVREKKAELQEEAKKLERRETSLDNRSTNLDKRESNLEQKENKLEQRISDIEKRSDKIEELIQEQEKKLMEISGYTQDEARQIVMSRLEEEMHMEMALYVKDEVEKAKYEATRKSQVILANAIQQYANETISEKTVSVVSLPNDEMKGRIIGREGRNIRSIETLTGVDLIIDDTPEAVILSSFDPVRREIARLSLEKLIVDGRIHPGRIEETVEKSRKEVEAIIKQEGEQATFDTGVHGLHPELIKILGRLKYRTSYGQNVLKHSIEVAHLAGLMAAELGTDVALAKRAGLLHDLGKAIDHEVEGSHVTIGADVAKKYKENDKVIHAIMAHHGDVEPNSLAACLVQAADSISAARTGARRENIESYIKRLQALEEIANSFNGVEKSFAIQAGREVRIMVKPDKVNDDETILLAKDIVKKIESTMEYPGQIKVNVIRELRTVEYAK